MSTVLNRVPSFRPCAAPDRGRDVLDPVLKPGTGDCKVLSGALVDPYDGTAVSFVSGSDTSRVVQIDHVVALGWARHHGAWVWTDEQRLLAANDPANLVAASDDTNQSKERHRPGGVAAVGRGATLRVSGAVRGGAGRVRVGDRGG